MLSTKDKEYKETKLIKQGKKELRPDFKSLAQWIEKEYGFPVLNIYYDTARGMYNKPFPRVRIIFEFQREELKFRDGFLGNYHEKSNKQLPKNSGNWYWGLK